MDNETKTSENAQFDTGAVVKKARPSTIQVPIDYLKYVIEGEDLYINANQNFFMKFSTTDKNSKKTKDN